MSPVFFRAASSTGREKQCTELTGHVGQPWSVRVDLLVAAVAALLVHDDPRTYTTPTGGGSTSDVVTITESLISLALAAAAVGSGWLLAPASTARVPPTTVAR